MARVLRNKKKLLAAIFSALLAFGGSYFGAPAMDNHVLSSIMIGEPHDTPTEISHP